jgi:hypothetical protein
MMVLFELDKFEVTVLAIIFVVMRAVALLALAWMM